MQSPQNYKTSQWLYKAVIKALDTLHGVKKAWYIHNAIWTAENIFQDDKLTQQIRQLAVGKSSVHELISYN